MVTASGEPEAESSAGARELAPLTAKQFEATDATGDWRALSLGASAVYRTASMRPGAAFAARVAALPGADAHADIDVRPEAVVVRLVTLALRRYTGADTDLAQQVSSAARELGLTPDPAAAQDVNLTLDALNREAVMPFWATLLGHDRAADDLVDPHRRWPPVWFQQMDAPRPLRQRIHLDVFVPHDVHPVRLDTTLADGGHVTNDAFAPGWWTLADAEGNEADLNGWLRFDYDPPEPYLTPDAFRALDGVQDWRVLQGAGAHYRTRSLAAGAELLTAAAALADDAALNLYADLRAGGVTFRLGPPEEFWISAAHADLARAIQSAARALGLTPDPAACRDVQIDVDALDIPSVRAVWAAALGYAERGEEDLFDPLLRGPSVYFQQMDAPRPQRNRMHVDVFVPADRVRDRVAAAVAAGGQVVYDEHAPWWWTVADPEGNEIDIATAVGLAEAEAAAQGKPAQERIDDE